MKAPVHPEPGWREGWFLVPHEVTWRDLDAIGHVNNAVYFTYFEWARTKYWFALEGGSSAFDLRFIVARAECDFLLQLGLTERIEIGVRISEMRRTSLDFAYEIRRCESRELVARGKVVVVMFSWAHQEKVEISEDFRRKVDRFQGMEGAG